jgi:hypothetical protein
MDVTATRDTRFVLIHIAPLGFGGVLRNNWNGSALSRHPTSLPAEDMIMSRIHRYWLTLPTVIAIAGTAAAAPASIAPSAALNAQPSGVQLAQTQSTTTTTTTYRMIAPNPPPALREELIPPPPAATVTWEPGRWSWNNDQWVWVAGQYVPRPTPQAVWEPGHWVQQANGWLWVDGQWRMAAN